MHRRIVCSGAVAALAVMMWTGGCGSSSKNGFAPGPDGGGAGVEGGGDDGSPGLVGDGSSAVPCSGKDVYKRQTLTRAHAITN